MPIVEKLCVLTKGPPWGFRVYIDNNNVLTISKVRPHGPADIAKLRSGDQIISMNARLASGLNHAEAINLIDTTIGTLNVKISRFESTSTQVLMFDRVDTSLHEDVKSEMNMNLSRPELTLDRKIEAAECVPVEETLIRPSSPDVQPVSIDKLIKEYDGDDVEDGNIPKKKHFADSSFYNDPYNLYPTTEEKMEMARRVASSLYAPDNKSSKGASIFERQRKRADKYTLEPEESSVNGFVSEEPKYDLAHWPEVAEHKERSPSPMYRLGYSSGLPVPPPPPAPPAFNEAKTVQEFMEKVQRFPKAKHNVVSPDVCFDIAAALHSNDSRGAQIFAKQKHRAQKWTLTAPETASAQPMFATTPGPSNNFKMPIVAAQDPKSNTAAFNRNQYKSNDNQLLTTSSSSGKPTHIIRRNSNQSTADSQRPSTILTVSNTSQAPAHPPLPQPADTVPQPVPGVSKWKPVKFNVPQKA